MKNTKFTLLLAAITFTLAATISSCKKEKNPADSDTSGASDNSLVERTSDDVTNMASEAADQGSLGSYKYANGGDESIFTSCATLVFDTANKTITATFNGTTCLDGRTRSGSLTFDYSGSTNGAKFYRNPGFKCVVTSNNYVVDGNAISINKTVTNTTAAGFNPATTNLTWSVATNVSIVKANGGGTVTWSANKTKTLLNTSDSTVYHGQAVHITWSKARVGITGNASGTAANGNSYTANITSQLVRDFNCSPNIAHPGHHPFIQGTLDFDPSNKPVRHFDYGNGSCDNAATVTINGNTYNITLP